MPKSPLWPFIPCIVILLVPLQSSSTVLHVRIRLQNGKQRSSCCNHTVNGTNATTTSNASDSATDSSNAKPVCSLGATNLSAVGFEQMCSSASPGVGTDTWGIFCSGRLLQAVNFHDGLLFGNDSKHFVDRPLLKDASEVIAEFDAQFPSEVPVEDMDLEALKEFVREHFGKADGVLTEEQPDDWIEQPPKFSGINDENLRTWAYKLNDLWKLLGRKMPDEIRQNQNRHSLLYVPHPFVVPGGRFREFYYWDAYWIVKGLIASGMHSSVKHMCQNFAAMVDQFGFVPNGGRIYYLKRSQPPFLTRMVYEYYVATVQNGSADTEFLREVLPTVEKELNFWQTQRAVRVHGTDFFQYRADSNVPRPESFCADVHNAMELETDEEKKAFWRNVASAAESGWDFSSRWMRQDPTGETEQEQWQLTDLQTTDIVPVDLNALICGNYQMLAYLFKQIGSAEKTMGYAKQYVNFRAKFTKLFHKDNVWYDYNLRDKALNKNGYYGSMAVPLFTGCYQRAGPAAGAQLAEQFYDSLSGMNFTAENGDRRNPFEYPFGVPTSLFNTGQQWDFPNIWPPLSHMLIEGLRRSGNSEMEQKAFDLAQRWLSASYKLFNEPKCQVNGTGYMWEKMDAQHGTPGSGGEYSVQIGFGWSIGAALDLLVTYGDRLVLDESNLPSIQCNPSEPEQEPEVFPPVDE